MAQSQDLSAILATLAQFSQPTESPRPEQDIKEQESTSPKVHHAQPEDHNSMAVAQNAVVEKPPVEQSADPRLRGKPQSRSVTPSTATPQSKSVIDPATITTWQDGLRCVTKIAGQNRMFEHNIRKMMQEQRAHEMRWYQERQALKQTQASRSSSSARALSILQSLNPDHVPEDKPSPENQEEAEAAELATFDGKVYAAQQSMEDAMAAQLKALGVPFFGTKQNVVLSSERDASQLQLPSSHAKHSPPVTEDQLLELRRKMIKHLEDLYRD